MGAIASSNCVDCKFGIYHTNVCLPGIISSEPKIYMSATHVKYIWILNSIDSFIYLLAIDPGSTEFYATINWKIYTQKILTNLENYDLFAKFICT